MLGDNIRKYRKENNISQEVLAEGLGVTRQSISLWENNQTQPSLENIVALAKTFNISTDDLLTDSKKENNENSSLIKTKGIVKKKTRFKSVIITLSVLLCLCICLGTFFIAKTFLKTTFSEDANAITSAEASVVKVFCYNYSGEEIATGSGVILFNNDVVVTNYHVVEGAYSVKISTDQDITYNVLGISCEDILKDISILKLERNTELTPLKTGVSTAVKKGETVTAIGSPFGIKNTVSKGNLSARIMEDGYDILQFTAPISNGSSGGALFNEKGEVIGITYASIVGGQNFNLAIPIELIENEYQKIDTSAELMHFEDSYWQENIEEYLKVTYGKTSYVSFNDLKENPEKYNNKLVTVRAFFSSGPEPLMGVLRYKMFVSSKKAISNYENDEQIWFSKNINAHSLLKVRTLKISGRQVSYTMPKGDYVREFLITGVFEKDEDYRYCIYTANIETLN